MDGLSLQTGIAGLLLIFRGTWSGNRAAKQASPRSDASACGRHRGKGPLTQSIQPTGRRAALPTTLTVLRPGTITASKTNPFTLQQRFLSHQFIGFYQITENIIIQETKAVIISCLFLLV